MIFSSSGQARYILSFQTENWECETVDNLVTFFLISMNFTNEWTQDSRNRSNLNVSAWLVHQFSCWVLSVSLVVYHRIGDWKTRLKLKDIQWSIFQLGGYFSYTNLILSFASLLFMLFSFCIISILLCIFQCSF